jgi:tetratricopeptide (TPR) repeat protein
MEHRLEDLGFDLPMTQITLPSDERVTKTVNDIISKFTVQSMENELAWASGQAAPSPERLFLQVGEGLWHDPQLVGNIHPASLERVIARRAMVQGAFRELPGCKIVIMTLGLAEAWFDHETGLYLNAAPPTAALRRAPERFSLDILDYDDIFSSLERIYAIIQRFGRPDFRMLLTVSPVPFKATFSGEDALVANSYSKAVQRAACQAFVARHDNVDYVPSYEIVTLSDRETVYERDNVHVSNSAVAYIVDQVLAAYAPGVEIKRTRVGVPKTRRPDAQDRPYDLLTRARHFFEEGDLGRAAGLCEEMFQRFDDQMSARDKSTGRNVYGVVLMTMKRLPEAAAQFQAAIDQSPGEAEPWHNLGKVCDRMGERRQAIAALQRAAEISPSDAGVQASLRRAKGPLGMLRSLGRKPGARPLAAAAE